MARPDWECTKEVRTLMDKMVSKFPSVFLGFNTGAIHEVITKGKRAKKLNKAVKLHPIRHPISTLTTDKVYVVEIMEESWRDMSVKQRNLAVFHVMCSIPEGGFDPDSKMYGKKRKVDFELFAEEFAVSNGVPNWFENEEARDPMEVEVKESDIKVPVTKEDIEGDEK